MPSGPGRLVCECDSTRGCGRGVGRARRDARGGAAHLDGPRDRPRSRRTSRVVLRDGPVQLRAFAVLARHYFLRCVHRLGLAEFDLLARTQAGRDVALDVRDDACALHENLDRLWTLEPLLVERMATIGVLPVACARLLSLIASFRPWTSTRCASCAARTRQGAGAAGRPQRGRGRVLRARRPTAARPPPSASSSPSTPDVIGRPEADRRMRLASGHHRAGGARVRVRAAQGQDAACGRARRGGWRRLVRSQFDAKCAIECCWRLASTLADGVLVRATRPRPREHAAAGHRPRLQRRVCVRLGLDPTLCRRRGSTRPAQGPRAPGRGERRLEVGFIGERVASAPSTARTH